MRSRGKSTSKKSYVRTFQRAGPGGRPKISKLLRTFNHKPCILSLQIKVLITILILTRLILSVIPLDFHPWFMRLLLYFCFYSSMSYLIYKLLKFIRRLVEKQDKIDRQSRHNSEDTTVMGNNSSVTSLAGVHGPSVGIAIGVSMGVLLSLAAYQYYQNRALKKRIQQLISVTPDMAVYLRPSSKNPFAYRNLGYSGNNHNNNQNQAPNNQAPINAGGIPPI